MFDTVLGLPLHALVVHAVVVLVPLSAVGVLAVAAIPRWRRRYGWLVLAVSTLALASAFVATQSGEAFEERFARLDLVTPAIERHAEFGGTVPWFVLAMWVLAVALLLLDRLRDNAAVKQRPERPEGQGAATRAAEPAGGQSLFGGTAGQGVLLLVVAVLSAAAAGAATVQVVRTGHAGSAAVWQDFVESSNAR